MAASVCCGRAPSHLRSLGAQEYRIAVSARLTDQDMPLTF
jgi:hypothetical protein